MVGDITHQATVLVIDDEASVCQGCRQALEEQGYHAEVAADADQGLRLAKQIRPNVVLVDLKLPGVGGIGVLNEMRQAVPDAVPIVITGYGTTQSAVQAMRMGAYDYLCKPFDDRALLEAVSQALAWHDADSQSAALEHGEQATSGSLIDVEGRSPQAPILGALRSGEPAGNGEIGHASPAWNRALERASGRVGAVSRRIRSWQGLAQMEEKLAQLRPSPVELGAVLKDSWAAIPAAEGRDRIALHVNMADGMIPVLGEANLLREAFTHLFRNAATFIPGAGRITVDAVSDIGCVVVSVSDTGRGIPAEGWPCVFEAFCRGAHPGAVNVDDSLLDLVTARRIVAAHGGTMTIQNGPGPGATFVLRLPAAPGESAKEEAMHRETVVVIDDEESMREGCRQALEGKGYVAKVAADGEEGLHLVEQCKPDVVLVDLKMPGIDGLETLRRIKQIDPYVVSIVITGYGTIESSVSAMRLGASDYLCKPFDDDQLLTAVESGLEGYVIPPREPLPPPHPREGKANRQTIIEVLEKAASEPRFAAELLEKGSEALEAYDLSSAEKAAIACGDLAWLEEHAGKLDDRQKSWLNCRLEQERW